MSAYVHLARTSGVCTTEFLRPYSTFLMCCMYATLTNVNFDAPRFIDYLTECQDKTESLRLLLQPKKSGLFSSLTSFFSKSNKDPIAFTQAFDLHKPLQARDMDALVQIGHSVGVQSRMQVLGSDVGSLQELLAYGLKGLCAYGRYVTNIVIVTILVF